MSDFKYMEETGLEKPVQLHDLPELHPRRILALLVRILLFTIIVIVPLVYYPLTKRNFEFPKIMMFRHLVTVAFLAWIVGCRQRVFGRLSDRWKRFAIPGIIIAVTAVFIYMTAPQANLFNLLVLGILPVAVTVACFKVSGCAPDYRWPLALPAIIYLTGICISLPAAPNMAECLDVKACMDEFLYVIFAFLVYKNCSSKKSIHMFVVLFLTVATMISVLGTLQYFRLDQWLETTFGLEGMHLAISKQGENDPVSTLGNRNYVAEYLEVAFPVALLMIIAARKNWCRALFIVSAVIIDSHLSVADTIGADVGILIGLVVVFVVVYFWWPVKRMHFMYLTSGWFMIEGLILFYRIYWDQVGQYKIYLRLVKQLFRYAGDPYEVAARVDAWYTSIPAKYSINSRNLQEMQTALEAAVARGQTAFSRNLFDSLMPFLLGLMIFLFTLTLYYLIPRIFGLSANEVHGSSRSTGGDSATNAVYRIKRMFAVCVAIIAVVCMPFLIRKQIDSGTASARDKIKTSWDQNKPVERHWYLRADDQNEFFYKEGGKEIKMDYYRPSQELKDIQFGDPYENPEQFGAKDYLLRKIMSRTFVFRAECWRGASRNIVYSMKKRHWLPFIGIGIQNFKITHPMRQFESQLERTILGKEVLARTVHNDYLAIGVENGIFSILGIFWIMMIVLRSVHLGLLNCKRRIDSEGESDESRFRFFLFAAILMGFVATMFHAGVSSNLLQPGAVTMFWFVSGLLPGAVKAYGGGHRVKWGVSGRLNRALAYGLTEETAGPTVGERFLEDDYRDRGAGNEAERPLYLPFFRHWGFSRTVMSIAFAAALCVLNGWFMHHWFGEYQMREGMTMNDEVGTWKTCRDYVEDIKNGVDELIKQEEILAKVKESGDRASLDGAMNNFEQVGREVTYRIVQAQSVLDNTFRYFRKSYPTEVAEMDSRLERIYRSLAKKEYTARDLADARKTSADLLNYSNGFIDKVYDRSYACFDKSLAFYPHYMETFYIVGRYYIDGADHRIKNVDEFNVERLDSGIQALRRDIYMNPNYKWAHNNLGVLYDNLVEVYKKKAKALRKQVESEGKIGESEERAKEYDRLADEARTEGWASYRRALDIDPDQIFALNNLGTGLFATAMEAVNRGDSESARWRLESCEKILLDTLRVEPDRWRAYDSLARIYMILREYPKMIQPAEWVAYHEKVGLVALYSKEFSQRMADAYVYSPVEMPANPGARPGYTNPKLAVSPLTAEERIDRALSIYKKLRNKSATDEAQLRVYSRRIALALEQKRDYEGAIKEIQGAYGASPKNATVCVELAAFYALKGDVAKAKDVLSDRIGSLNQAGLDKIVDTMISSTKGRTQVINMLSRNPDDVSAEEDVVSSTDEIKSATH